MLRELIERRRQRLADARAIADRYPESEITGDDRERYDRLVEEVRTLGERIEQESQLVEAERNAAEAALEQRGRVGPEGVTSPEEDRERRPEEERDRLAMVGFRSWLARGRVDGQGAEELRALQAESDPDGGYLIPPVQFVNQLIQAVDDQVFIRGLSTTQQVANAQSLGVPSLDTDASDSDWTSELGTGNEETAIKFGRRDLAPHALAKRVKISQALIRRSVLPAEDIVTGRLAYKFGITQEKAFLIGTGVNQPLGVFTASSDGISTSRDVSEDMTTTEITADGLKSAKYALKGNYWPRATWLFHRDALKQIAKLKDGEGRYMWQESIQAGQPDRLLNMPFRMSEYVPNTFTAGQYVGILGDFKNYWIADALSMQMQRLVELYAETNQVGFIGRLETDGMPVLEEAFVRVTLASS